MFSANTRRRETSPRPSSVVWIALTAALVLVGGSHGLGQSADTQTTEAKTPGVAKSAPVTPAPKPGVKKAKPTLESGAHAETKQAPDHSVSAPLEKMRKRSSERAPGETSKKRALPTGNAGAPAGDVSGKDYSATEDAKAKREVLQ